MRAYISGSVSYDILLQSSNDFGHLFATSGSGSLSVGFHVDAMRVSFGGPAANMAYHLTRLGVAALPIAAVGSDFGPYANWLGNNQVEQSGLTIASNLKTPRAYIQTDIKQNQILAFYTGSMCESHRLAPPAEQPDVCIVGPDDARAQRARLEQFAVFDCPIVFDPGQSITALTPDDLTKAVSMCSLMIVNDYELRFAASSLHCAPTELVNSLEHGLIVTDGERGSRLLSRDTELRVPATPCPLPIDPTGCGDAYRAGLIAAYLRGESIRDAMVVGSDLAAKVLAQHGAQGQQLDDETMFV